MVRVNGEFDFVANSSLKMYSIDSQGVADLSEYSMKAPSHLQ